MGLGLLIPLGTAGAALAQDTSTAAASHAASASRTTTPSYRFSLSSHTAAFDSVNIGANSTLTVTFTNTGAKALHPVSVTSGSSEFSLTGGTCAGAQVAAKGTCTYQATFTPTVAGAVTGSLQVLTAEGTPAQNVALSGTGVQQLMESYHFLYTYTNPPAINGVAAPQSFEGAGYAPVGTYTPGQVITVLDKATGLHEIGQYRIGNVDNTVPADPAKLQTVSVTRYTWGTKAYTPGVGLSSNTGTTGLGSESGALIGMGAEGTNAPFTDQYPAIHPSHW